MPENRLLRQIERVVDFNFIYDLVVLVLLQYLYGIRSIRQTIEDIRYHNAYRWFLGSGAAIYNTPFISG